MEMKTYEQGFKCGKQLCKSESDPIKKDEIFREFTTKNFLKPSTTPAYRHGWIDGWYSLILGEDKCES